MDKAIYVGFFYGTYFDTLQPYFSQEKLQLQYIDTLGMILSMKSENIIKGLKNWENIFDFSNLDETHEILSKNKQTNCW